MFMVDGLCKSFASKEILHNISFSINKSEIVALLGPNGAGKTTLMRSMIGFYTLDSGKVSFDGMSISDNRISFAQKIAYVPETGGLYPELSVAEYVRFMSDIKHLPQNEYDSRFNKIVAALGLDEVLNQKCETLSKGFSRRVAIAGAIIGKPELLILDEPWEGLDLPQKISLRSFLKEYSRECAILISTHVMEDIEQIIERVLLINHGDLVCDSAIAELKDKFHHSSLEDVFCSIIKG